MFKRTDFFKHASLTTKCLLLDEIRYIFKTILFQFICKHAVGGGKSERVEGDRLPVGCPPPSYNLFTKGV